VLNSLSFFITMVRDRRNKDFTDISFHSFSKLGILCILATYFCVPSIYITPLSLVHYLSTRYILGLND
jgi:hypothetical protein